MTNGDVILAMALLRGFAEIMQIPDPRMDQVLTRAKNALDERRIDPPNQPGPP